MNTRPYTSILGSDIPTIFKSKHKYHVKPWETPVKTKRLNLFTEQPTENLQATKEIAEWACPLRVSLAATTRMKQ